MSNKEVSASQAGTVSLGSEISVHRLGYGAMRLTGPGIWGPPKDRKAALAVLQRAVELGVNFIDTADSYGPHACPTERANGYKWNGGDFAVKCESKTEIIDS